MILVYLEKNESRGRDLAREKVFPRTIGQQRIGVRLQAWFTNAQGDKEIALTSEYSYDASQSYYIVNLLKSSDLYQTTETTKADGHLRNAEISIEEITNPFTLRLNQGTHPITNFPITEINQEDFFRLKIIAWCLDSTAKHQKVFLPAPELLREDESLEFFRLLGRHASSELATSDRKRLATAIKQWVITGWPDVQLGYNRMSDQKIAIDISKRIGLKVSAKAVEKCRDGQNLWKPDNY